MRRALIIAGCLALAAATNGQDAPPTTTMPGEALAASEPTETIAPLPHDGLRLENLELEGMVLTERLMRLQAQVELVRLQVGDVNRRYQERLRAAADHAGAPLDVYDYSAERRIFVRRPPAEPPTEAPTP